MINDGNPFAPLNQKTDSKVEEEVVAKNEIPENVNTIKEIIEWVGEDQDKAILVLENEESSDKPRTTLIERLEEIINND